MRIACTARRRVRDGFAYIAQSDCSPLRFIYGCLLPLLSTLLSFSLSSPWMPGFPSHDDLIRVPSASLLPFLFLVERRILFLRSRTNIINLTYCA